MITAQTRIEKKRPPTQRRWPFSTSATASRRGGLARRTSAPQRRSGNLAIKVPFSLLFSLAKYLHFPDVSNMTWLLRIFQKRRHLCWHFDKPSFTSFSKITQRWKINQKVSFYNITLSQISCNLFEEDDVTPSIEKKIQLFKPYCYSEARPLWVFAVQKINFKDFGSRTDWRNLTTVEDITQWMYLEVQHRQLPHDVFKIQSF